MTDTAIKYSGYLIDAINASQSASSRDEDLLDLRNDEQRFLVYPRPRFIAINHIRSKGHPILVKAYHLNDGVCLESDELNIYETAETIEEAWEGFLDTAISHQEFYTSSADNDLHERARELKELYLFSVKRSL